MCPAQLSAGGARSPEPFQLAADLKRQLDCALEDVRTERAKVDAERAKVDAERAKVDEERAKVDALHKEVRLRGRQLARVVTVRLTL